MLEQYIKPRKKYLYMRVTRDKYELPLAVADSEAELAEMLGLQRTTVHRGFRKKKSAYRKVEI